MVRFGKKYDVFNKKWQSLLTPTVYYKMASPDLIFFYRMEAYTRVNPTHSVEEMARGMAIGFLYGPKHPNTFFWEISSNSEKTLRYAAHALWLQDPLHDFIPLPNTAHALWLQDRLHDFILLRYAVHALWLQDPLHDFIFETWILHQIRFCSQHVFNLLVVEMVRGII